MVKVWARLLAVILQHWLLLTSVWGNPSKSLAKACAAIRKFAVCLAASMGCVADVRGAIQLIARATHSTVQRRFPQS